MSVEAESCFKPNIKKFTSELLCIMVCAAKETVCTCGVKHGIERVKEYGIQEYWYKDARCLYDQTDVGTSFFGILFQNGVYAYIGDVWLNWSRC